MFINRSQIDVIHWSRIGTLYQRKIVSMKNSILDSISNTKIA